MVLPEPSFPSYLRATETAGAEVRPYPCSLSALFPQTLAVSGAASCPAVWTMQTASAPLCNHATVYRTLSCTTGAYVSSHDK